MKSTLLWLASFLIIPGLTVLQLTAQAGDIPVTPDNEAQILNLGAINTPYSEYTPYITADEQYLFFQSNRPDGVNQTGDFDLWFAENEVSEGIPKFRPPANVGLPINSAYFDGHPSLRRLPSGEYEIYFCSYAEEGRQGPQLTNIYYSILKNNKWTIPVPVIEINTDFHDRMPSISQDGRFLFFSSDRPGGFGRDDIWFSEYDFAAKRWGKPVNAGRTINTPASEVTPAIHSDNITLYFSSDRAGGLGGYDIYVTQLINNLPAASSGDGESMWKKPQNLGKPYNSPLDDEYPTVIRTGKYMYFASNREGGQGSFDIYRAKVPDFAKPEVVVTLKGRVKEKFSEKGIEANIRITDADGERNFSTQQPEGLYSADLVNKKQYKLTVTAPGYQAIEYIADLRDINTPITMQKDFEMERIIALPKELKLNIAFVDEKGRMLKPAATYRLTPELVDDVILPFKKNIGRVKIPVMSRYKKPEDALAALDKMQLSVAAKKQGYVDVAESRNMAELIRGKNGELKDVIDLTFTMQTGEATPDVEVVKCKAGSGCVAVAYFSTNVSSRLNNEKAAGLKHVVAMWNKEPHKYVYVNGHADSRGSKAHNLKLSRARAAFVKRRLVQYGIPAEMIITKGYGATHLASKDETTVAGRRKNRRAEIFFDSTKRPGDEAVEDKAAPRKKPAKKTIKKPGKKPVEKPLPPEEVEPTKKTPDAPPTKSEQPPETPDTPSDKSSGVEEKSPFSQPKESSTKPSTPGVPSTEIKIQ